MSLVFKTQGFGAHTLQSEERLCDLFMMQGFGAQTLHSALSLMPLVDLLLALAIMTQGPGAHRLQSVDLSVFEVFREQGWGAHTLNSNSLIYHVQKILIDCADEC